MKQRIKTLRSDIENGIQKLIATQYTGVTVRLQVSTKDENGGLFINFLSSTIPRGKFHLTIHDKFFRNPSTFIRSMAHTTGDGRVRDNVRSSVQTVLRLECIDNGRPPDQNCLL